MNRDGWLLQMASCSVSTGNSQEAVGQPVTQSGTNAQGAGKLIMGLKAALERRRLEPLTPYIKKAWAELLEECGLDGRYLLLIQGLAKGFDVGIPCITCTYTPPNHASVKSLPDVYNSIINIKFNQVVTSGLSRVANWNQPWAPSKPHPCPWYQKHRNQGSSGLYIIFPTHTTLPPTLRPSTRTSIAMTSPATGELS